MAGLSYSDEIKHQSFLFSDTYPQVHASYSSSSQHPSVRRRDRNRVWTLKFSGLFFCKTLGEMRKNVCVNFSLKWYWSFKCYNKNLAKYSSPSEGQDSIIYLSLVSLTGQKGKVLL